MPSLRWPALPRRLTTRLALSLGGILAVILVGYSTWAMQGQKRLLRDRVQAEATDMVHAIAIATVGDVLNQNDEAVGRTLRRFAAFSDVREIMVLDTSGRPRGNVVRNAQGLIRAPGVASVQALPAGLAASTRVISHQEGHLLEIWHPLLARDLVGWVRLTYDTTALENAMEQNWQTMHQAAAVALALFVLSLFLTLRGPIRALQLAAEFARQLDRRKGRHLPLFRGAVEVEDLFIALNLASVRLKEGEEILRLHASVFENTREGILITDAENRIVQINKAFTTLTGYSRREILGKTPNVLASGRHDEGFWRNMWRAIHTRGYWSGEIWNRHRNGSEFVARINISAVRDDYDRVTHYIGVFGDITDRKESEERLARLAHFDRLTGLPNRTLLLDRLERSVARARRHGGYFAVCFVDLDGFKPINDTWGHETGDRVLTQVANRMVGTVRDGDTVARLGGDEFVILLEPLREQSEIETTLERVLRAISEPYLLEGLDIRLSASIGVALYPQDGRDAEILLRQADLAMYQAKADGRGVYRLLYKTTTRERDVPPA